MEASARCQALAAPKLLYASADFGTRINIIFESNLPTSNEHLFSSRDNSSGSSEAR